MDRGVWRATVCGIEKSQTRLSTGHSTVLLQILRVLPTSGGAAGTSVPAWGRGANPSLLDPPQRGQPEVGQTWIPLASPRP